MLAVEAFDHLSPCHALQVREEAGELCQTLGAQEGPERAASEMADLLYHAMVLLNVQVCVLCVSVCLPLPAVQLRVEAGPAASG